MAPDRGSQLENVRAHYEVVSTEENGSHEITRAGSEDLSPSRFTSNRSRSCANQTLVEDEHSFTLRGVLVGLLIGVIICFSNMYFGLQTGWVSGMAMPAALIGFAFFKSIARYISFPFTPLENVLVQTVAGAVGTMPLGCGFVGVLPALNYMLAPEENGPLVLGTGKLMVWSLGICLFGVFIAVPLRREVIIREKLKFPSGTATALMIEVLHGEKCEPRMLGDMDPSKVSTADDQDGQNSQETRSVNPQSRSRSPSYITKSDEDLPADGDWRIKIKNLILAFAISGLYTLIAFFIPQIRQLPILGLPIARQWLWTLNPSPAYLGQGIIMGPATTLHMLLGAILGWGILSPLAKSKGWAPGPVEDWETGSKGWIIWVSLAIMLADSIVSLSWLVLRPVIRIGPGYTEHLQKRIKRDGWHAFLSFEHPDHNIYASLTGTDPSSISISNPTAGDRNSRLTDEQDQASILDVDAPQEQLVSNVIAWIGFVISILLCIAAVHVVFGSMVPLYATISAVIFAILLSIMGVRALGETDLNPVSGISKLTQLFFALIIPRSNKNSIIINLIAGAISESGALQAGDMMQDLKTGHLLGAAPKAQFYGQVIGSLVGAIVSAAVYQLYTSVYQIPGDLFQVPTGYVWIFTARLVTGKGLPPMAWEGAVGAGAVSTVVTALRITGQGKVWQCWFPGGIAVAIGMYNVPSFTLARTIGGLITWYWRFYRHREEAPLIVLASGLILGEGVASILNLLLANFNVPHL
ncbi:hypothetical protein MMC09_000347 [Bachmanniomyces sp. S44760]|nr:hypothetical protein [Bachmanniomyces sp. S44760]